MRQAFKNSSKYFKPLQLCFDAIDFIFFFKNIFFIFLNVFLCLFCLNFFFELIDFLLIALKNILSSEIVGKFKAFNFPLHAMQLLVNFPIQLLTVLGAVLGNFANGAALEIVIRIETIPTQPTPFFSQTWNFNVVFVLDVVSHHQIVDHQSWFKSASRFVGQFLLHFLIRIANSSQFFTANVSGLIFTQNQ